jgi:hypothetical protein
LVVYRKMGIISRVTRHLPHTTGATTACHNGWHIVRAITITETES